VGVSGSARRSAAHIRDDLPVSLIALLRQTAKLSIALLVTTLTLSASAIAGMVIVARRRTRPTKEPARKAIGRLVGIEVERDLATIGVPTPPSADEEARAVWQAAGAEPGFDERLGGAIERMDRDDQVVPYEPRRRVG
jgi:hypothetical protein